MLNSYEKQSSKIIFSLETLSIFDTLQMRDTSSIFIAGNSRSGTTMMGRILGNNAAVFTFHELHFFEQLWAPGKDVYDMAEAEAVGLFSKLISLQRQGYLRERTPDLFNAESKKVLENYNGRNWQPYIFEKFLLNESELNGKKIPCEQTPRNVFFINEILELYPQAKVVCMVRDPRDVLLSQKNKWKRRFLGAKTIPLKESLRSWVNYHPITISKLWNSSASKIVAAKNKERVFVLKFEELIDKPNEIIESLCAFLDISFDEKMLAVPQVGSSTAADDASKTGVNKEKAGNFRKELNSTEIYYCQRITNNFRQQFGYEDVQIGKNYLMIIWYAFTFPVKIFFALSLNLKRTRNLIDAIKRRF